MRFEVLGPLRVLDGDQPLALSGRIGRLLLAALLARANNAVPVDVLSDVLWGGASRAEGAKKVAWHVHKLRQRLGADDRIVRDGLGYRIRVAPDELDALRYEHLVEEAGLARGNGDLDTAAHLLSRAETLWRGLAYRELADHELFREEATRLEHVRFIARQRRVDIELARGNHEDIVGEIKSLVDEFPLHEEFRAQLMLALYRSGRKTESLEAYRDTRRLLTEQLGLDPGPRLRELESAIVNDAPSLDAEPAAATSPVPAELPADIGAFTGRRAELDELGDKLARTPATVAISGAGGIGKSALAIRLGHRLARRFRDGQLYINLRGATPEATPIDPGQALARFLRSLGDRPGPITDAQELASRFRTVTARKRVLVVLDDAADVAQVRPLLPAGAGCAVIITSRRPMATLDDAVSLRLDGLSDAESHELLSQVVGSSRIDADADAAVDLVRLCAGMPLALGICASRLQVRPQWSVARLTAKLSHSRLSALSVDDLAVRSSFMVSYQDLNRDGHGSAAARMFRLLGLHDGPDISLPVAAAMSDVDDDRAEDLLNALSDAQLVVSTAPGRYRMHDLLRLFARELADTDESIEQCREARVRMWHKYVATARAARRSSSPGGTSNLAFGPSELRYAEPHFRSAAAAEQWTTTELANVVALCRRPLDGLAGVEMAALIAADCVNALRDQGEPAQLTTLLQTVCEHADRANASVVRGTTHLFLGEVLRRQGKLDQARHHLEVALGADPPGETSNSVGGVLVSLAAVCRKLGELDRAASYVVEGIRVSRLREHAGTELAGLIQLSFIHEANGRIDDAIASQHDAARAAVRINAYIGQSSALGNIANIQFRAGRVDEAIDTYSRVLAMDHQHGLNDGIVHADHLWGKATALAATGETAAARDHWNRAAAILRRLNIITDAERSAIETSDHPQTPHVLR